MPSKVFISYRRDDSEAHAGRVHDRLEREFGPEFLFMDVDAIPLGANFTKVLRDEVAKCDVLLALIGPNWLNVRDEEGNRRLDNPADFLRIEISTALQRSIPVIPILLDGARIPEPDELPKDLKELSVRNGFGVRHASFRSDMDRLIRELRLTERSAQTAPTNPVAASRPVASTYATDPIQVLRNRLAKEDGLVPTTNAFPDAKVVQGAESKFTPETDFARRLNRLKSAVRQVLLGWTTAAIAALLAIIFVAVLLQNRNATTGDSWRADEARRRAEAAEQSRAEQAAKAEAEAKRRADEEVAALAEKNREQAPQIETDRRQAEAGAERRADEATAQRDVALPVKPGSGQSFRDPLADGRPCPQCPEMVVVPAGKFTMGSPAKEEGRTAESEAQVPVTISLPFVVGKFAVTFDQWDACVADGGCTYRPHDEGWGRANRPVINVNWADANTYAEWLSRKTGKVYRLLSEAEWEYVARAGTTTPFWWGPSITTELANHNGNLTYGRGLRGEYRGRTVPVDTFEPNPWGLFNVHGNVQEWTADCWNPSNQGNPGDGSARSTGDCRERVIRGGSWYVAPQYLRAAFRIWVNSNSQYNTLGFRMARTLNP
jgi:formylglycine-generating enzyme required for sulfatase activity